MERGDLTGTRMMELEGLLPASRWKERIYANVAAGLESAEAVGDRAIPLFAPALRYDHAGTFAAWPYLHDLRALGNEDAAVFGVPYDGGASYRAGARFGPQAIRAASVLTSGYHAESGVDLWESLEMVDAGDVSVIPANIEKTFAQIEAAVRHVHGRGVFPVALGGDHSISYPLVKGLASGIDGNLGIIHFDRHSDLSPRGKDEPMHGTPFWHATNLPNVPATNLVQIGIGGWGSTREGIRAARERGATVVTMDDIDRFGVERVGELALETAWKGAAAVYLSFDIDCVDPAFAPGTGTPEPGGFTPRELFRLLRLVAREGLTGMDVVEVNPHYDAAETTALLATRVVHFALGSQVEHGKLGRRFGEGKEAGAGAS